MKKYDKLADYVIMRRQGCRRGVSKGRVLADYEKDRTNSLEDRTAVYPVLTKHYRELLDAALSLIPKEHLDLLIDLHANGDENNV